MVYVSLYLLAIVLANLSVLYFGISAVYINAFLFIGLDLTSRDKLHDLWHKRGLVWKMFCLILAGSVLSYLMNREVFQIALASTVAFGFAAIVDSFAYQLLNKYPRWLRINGSNVPSALVDSIVFPTIAFGGFILPVVLGQFCAKVAGGLFWSLIIKKFDRLNNK